MKKIAYWILSLLALAMFGHAENSAVASLNVIPLPVLMKALTGTFPLNGQTRIVAVDNESRRIAGLFNDFLLSQYGFRLHLTATPPKAKNLISFSRAASRG